MNQERILCAAVYIDNKEENHKQPFPFPTGYVICGHNHAAIKEVMQMLNIKPEVYNEGFLTSHNRFVSRATAADIAWKDGQIGAVVKELLSDMLY